MATSPSAPVDPADDNRPARDLVGRNLDGRFRIERRIGAGGMGEVYVAQQLNIERNVAIKVLRRERLGDADAVTRFLDEARTISRLTSPHTVTLHDVGELSEGDYYIAMEFLEGRTLHDLLDEGAVPAEEAVRILDSIALSLAEAHAHGIVHRDLKPLNVLLGRAAGHAEIVKVVDFGLATIGRADDPHRRGTPRYMAPEAIRGRRVGAPADVYAIGLIAFEMFSGTHPFAGLSGKALLEAHLHRDVPPLDEVVPELSLPRAVRQLVARCLAKPPKLRPRDAGVFRRQLREAFGLSVDTSSSSVTSPRDRSVEEIETLETKATMPSTMSLTEFERRFSSPAPRWPWLLGAGGVLALALSLFWWRRPDALETTTPAEVPAPSRVTVLVHSVPEGASVTADGLDLGVTPTNVSLPGGLPTTLTLHLPGFDDGHLVVTPHDGDKIRHVFRAESIPDAPAITPSAEPSATPPWPRPVTRPPAPTRPTASPSTTAEVEPDPRAKVDQYLD